MQLVYDTSGCSSQGLSWSRSNRYLNRSKLASTRLCNNHIIIIIITDEHKLHQRLFKLWVKAAGARADKIYMLLENIMCTFSARTALYEQLRRRTLVIQRAQRQH